MTSKAFVHSYSAGKIYDQCPYRFEQDRVLRRFPFVQSEAAAEGDRIHDALAQNTEHGAPLPEKYKWLQPIADAVARRPGAKLVEQKWGLTKMFTPTGYFDDDVYYRYRNDYVNVGPDGTTAVLIDYKTGSDKYPDTEQLVEGAVTVMVHMPKVLVVASALVFTKTGRVLPVTYTREHLDDYCAAMAAKYARIDAAIAVGEYPKTPGPLCPWCPVTECEFWRPPPQRRK